MCGITGIFAFNELGRFFSINLQNANETLSRRGPDSGRLFTDYYVGLGHRRLSIIDLSSDSNQPMHDASERYVIVFNGEIYNYQKLREELIKQGVAFRTQGDTEVLLNLYIKYGEKCLEKLVGFFAFAIYDKQESTIFLARDRMGIKPLLYFMDEDKFIFASEMRALLAYNIGREVDFTSMYQYFQLSYIPAPYTIFKNVYKLMPGHYMKVKKREIETKPFYQIPYKPETQLEPIEYVDAKKKLLELLETSVKDRLIADVPVGAFLSGGIDSSTVVAIAARFHTNLKTFSVGFKNEPLYDETKYAELVAKKFGTDHTVFNITTDDYFEHILDILSYFGEPFADSSAIPTYILSKKVSQRVKVALSGDGGDELFAGYQKHLGEWKIRQGGLDVQLATALEPLWSKLPQSRGTYWGNKVRQLQRLTEAKKMSDIDRYWYLCSWNTPEKLQTMLTPKAWYLINQQAFAKRRSEVTAPIKSDGFNEVLLADMKTLLPNDMLHKVDSMSMAHGLEVRVPLLDHRIVNFAFTLPSSHKIDGDMKKKILQDTMRDILPQELYNRPKKGFDVPLSKGYKKELRSWIEQSVLNDAFIQEQGIFDIAYIRQLKHDIFNTENFDQNQVWAILAFQHWWQQFIRKSLEEVVS